MSWLSENIGTIVVAAIVFGAAATIMIRTIRAKKSGKSTCGCNCASCSGCHKS